MLRPCSPCTGLGPAGERTIQLSVLVQVRMEPEERMFARGLQSSRVFHARRQPPQPIFRKPGACSLRLPPSPPPPPTSAYSSAAGWLERGGGEQHGRSGAVARALARCMAWRLSESFLGFKSACKRMTGRMFMRPIGSPVALLCSHDRTGLARNVYSAVNVSRVHRLEAARRAGLRGAAMIREPSRSGAAPLPSAPTNVSTRLHACVCPLPLHPRRQCTGTRRADAGGEPLLAVCRWLSTVNLTTLVAANHFEFV